MYQMIDANIDKFKQASFIVVNKNARVTSYLYVYVISV